MMFSRLIHRVLPYTKTYYPSRIIRRPLLEKLTRSYSGNAAELPDLCRLRSRGLIEVKGADAIPFLQGLVTNDVTLLEEQTKCIYTMLLNVQGRVHYDLLLYNIQQSGNESTILLECDHLLIQNLIKEIKRYKIRKKVSIEHNESLSVYTKLQQSTHIPVLNSAIIIEATDPRVPELGSRLIGKPRTTDKLNEDIESKDESLYHEHRVKLGVPEGPLDLPFGNCLPLESNLVYMNGVSFSKGCYLGQELTARTHHTGVIRKRIMPLVFTEPPPEIGDGENITNEQGKSVGKFRSCIGAHGLGLMRIADVKGELTVKTRSWDSVKLTAIQPDWWPKD